jgi:signal transduction histidine kinase
MLPSSRCTSKHFASAGWSPTWRPRLTTVILDQRDRHAELIVADDESGIPPDELPRVFERIFPGAGTPAGVPGSGARRRRRVGRALGAGRVVVV